MINFLPTLDLPYLMAGATVILSGSICLMKLLMPSAPERDALAILEGSDRFYFRAAPFKQKGLCSKRRERTCKNIKIEFFSKNSEKNKNLTFSRLSQRDPSAEEKAEEGQPVQIRFKYKDGMFWTGWSGEIETSISEMPFQLESFEDNGNQMQPDNGQERPKNETEFYKQKNEHLKTFIRNKEGIIIRFLGPIGVGKSSLFNTLWSTWNGKYSQVATTYSGCGSVTGKVDVHELKDKVWLADIPGFQTDSCFDLIPELIEGFHDGKEIDLKKQPPQTPAALEDWKTRQETRQKTAIIIVLDPRDLEEEKNINRKIILALVAGGKFLFSLIFEIIKTRL